MKRTADNKRSFATELNKAWLSDEEFEKVKVHKENTKDSVHPTAVSEDQIHYSNNATLPNIPIDLSHDNILLARGIMCYLFNPKTHEFTRITDTLRDRSYFETIYVGNKLYAISTFSVVASGTIEYFEFDDKSPHLSKWNHATSLPKTLRSIGATLSHDGKIIITGGIDVDTLVRTDEVLEAFVDVSNPGQLEWKVKSSKLSTPRFRHAAITASNGEIWVAGGILNIQNHDCFTGTTEVYNCEKDVWTAGPTMVIQRAINLNLMLVNDTIYAVGGDVMMPTYQSDGGPVVGSIERLNKSTNAWEFVTNFPTERHGISACALGDIIYIFGGRTGVSDLTTWDAYDVSTGQWLSVESKKVLRMPEEMELLYGSACAMPANKKA